MAKSEQQIQAGTNATRASGGVWWRVLPPGPSISVSATCSNSTVVPPVIDYVLHVISIVCFAIALTGFGTGLVEFRRFPGTTSEEGGSHFDRAHFQALLGMAFSLSFAVVVIAGSVPRWILSPCE